MKNGHVKVHTQSTAKYSYPPESFIMIMCVLLTLSDIGIDFQIIFYKLKELFLLRSFHMLQVLYLIILLSLFQALVLMTIPIFSHTRVFAVPRIKSWLPAARLAPNILSASATSRITRRDWPNFHFRALFG